MSREPWYDLTVLLGSTLFRAIDLRIATEGVEHLPTEGPAVVAANHVGFLDFMTIAAAGRRRGRNIRFLCRHDVWNSPLARRGMTGMRHVPVDRAAPAAAYLMARRLLGEGEVVAVFPEAGISHSYTVRSLMVGAAALARETGAPLVPAVQWGTQLVASPGRRLSARRGRRVDLRFAPPVDVPRDADPRVVTEALGHLLTCELEELQRRPHHVPAPGTEAWWYPAHLGGAAPDRAAAAPRDVVPRSAVPPTWGPGAPPG